MLSFDDLSPCFVCKWSISADAEPCHVQGRGPVRRYHAQGQAEGSTWSELRVKTHERHDVGLIPSGGVQSNSRFIWELTYWAEAARFLMLFELIVRHNVLAALRGMHARKSLHALRHLLKSKVANALFHVAPTHWALRNLLNASPAEQKASEQRLGLVCTVRKYARYNLLADGVTSLALVDRCDHDVHAYGAFQSPHQAILQHSKALQ